MAKKSGGGSPIKGPSGTHSPRPSGVTKRGGDPSVGKASMPNTGRITVASLGPSEGGHSSGSGRASYGKK